MSGVRRAFSLQLLGTAVALGLAAYAFRTWPVTEYVARAQGYVASLGWLGLVLYPLLFAACNLLLLPAGTLALGSGLFFGLGWGFLVNFTGNLLGAAAMMAIGRRLGRGRIRRWLLGRPRWAALDEAVGREGWKIIFLAQLLPFAPSSLLNYLFGVTRVPPGRALLWSALGQAPTMFVYAWLGTLAQFGVNLARGTGHPRLVDYATWGGGLLVAILATVGLAKISARLLAEAERRTAPEAVAPPPADSQAIAREPILTEVK